ncbi:enhanced serine sensitivity protein SseB [Ligilactobacillus equi]|uniref:enhanced serine sensitivity protein SseB C-terminal domain-containing protein n=1 Tax=Ligilactobacillus equi TaxID=137357 RepID=UPI002ED3FC0A
MQLMNDEDKRIVQVENGDNSVSQDNKKSLMQLDLVRFEKRLQEFMANPQNTTNEMEFVSVLCSTLFYVPVMVGRQQISRNSMNPGLKMDIATMTFLADGNQYVPIFSDINRMNEFLKTTGRRTELRPVLLNISELMYQVKKINVVGVLIEPGKFNFPLSTEYWSYLEMSRPIEASMGDNFKLKIMPRDITSRIEDKLKPKLRWQKKVKRAWVLGVQLPGKDVYEYLTILEYNGDKDKFQGEIARKLALAVRDALPRGKDLLIGTTEDFVGQAVIENFTPFYVRKSGFLRR